MMCRSWAYPEVLFLASEMEREVSGSKRKLSPGTYEI